MEHVSVPSSFLVPTFIGKEQGLLLTKDKVRDIQSAQTRSFGSGKLRPGAVFDDADSRREGGVEGEEQEAEVKHGVFWCIWLDADSGREG